VRIGFVGLGKLGLPCALAIESKGHEVRGYDVSRAVRNNIAARKITYREAGAQALLDASHIQIVPIDALVEWAQIIFVAVQTPHEPLYEGTVPLPPTRVDFDYTHLQKAVAHLSACIDSLDSPRTVVVISTVLPGTMDRKIVPLLNKHVRLCYNPFFIAMGTCIADFLAPEFVLLGVQDEAAAQQVSDFYGTLHDRPVFKTGIREAEAVKVFYNTFITTKLGFVNTVMEVCHKMGIDVDQVTDALKLGTQRIISPAYMSAGMGDGGGCHPRDNIALSWLARELDMRYDWFDQIMVARERQTEWLADLIRDHRRPADVVVILGRSFKPESNIVTGSPALLLADLLADRGIMAHSYDPQIDKARPAWDSGTLFFIGTKHAAFAEMEFPKGSVVLDPWRYIPDQDGVQVVRIAEGRRHVAVGHA
jgi:UDPglucose 6-dehydrogenase